MKFHMSLMLFVRRINILFVCLKHTTRAYSNVLIALIYQLSHHHHHHHQIDINQWILEIVRSCLIEAKCDKLHKPHIHEQCEQCNLFDINAFLLLLWSNFEVRKSFQWCTVTVFAQSIYPLLLWAQWFFSFVLWLYDYLSGLILCAFIVLHPSHFRMNARSWAIKRAIERRKRVCYVRKWICIVDGCMPYPQPGWKFFLIIPVIRYKSRTENGEHAPSA